MSVYTSYTESIKTINIKIIHAWIFAGHIQGRNPPYSLSCKQNFILMEYITIHNTVGGVGSLQIFYNFTVYIMCYERIVLDLVLMH